MYGSERRQQFHGKKMAIWLMLHIIAGGIYILAIRPGNMQDAPYWVYRIGALAEEMRIKGLLHALPPRILSVTFNGYGYGAPLFYCDVFLWIPAVFVLLGMSEFTSFNLLCAVIWSARAAVAVFSAYLVLKRFSEVKNRQELAILFAFAYSCFPYMIEVLLVRGAIGESLASIFFPLIAATLYAITYANNKNPNYMLLLALGLFGVICSHTISIMITTCCVIVYILFHWKLFWRDKWKFVELCKAGVLAAGLSAFWLFPFIEQYFTHILPDMEGWWWHNIVHISDWFISYYHFKSRQIWYPSTFGILLIAWTIFYLTGSNAYKNKQISIVLLTSWLLCIFMTSPTAMKALENQMGFMQFAWRLLSVVALLLSVVIVFVYYASTRKKWMFIAIYMLYVVCFFLGDRAYFHAALVFDTSITYERNNADSLYIPQGGIPKMHDVRGEFVDSNLTELQFEWERLPEARFRLKYSNNTGSAVVQLPLYYYKGYEAYDLVNQSKLFTEKGDIGLIWVHLEPYETGEVVVTYGGTNIQKAGNMFSLFAWMLLVLLIKRHEGILNKSINGI